MNCPVILIVGRPNVGKSTLFNRLAGRPAAVVFDRPGVTRDLLETELSLEDVHVKLMDSAGWPYPGEDADLSAKINKKVEGALKKSAVILWVVEGPTGRTGGEDAFAERLRPYRKKTVLVVNKVDELQRESSAWADSEFAGLPWDSSIPITAKHGRGLAGLLSLIETRLKDWSADSAEDPDTDSDIKISILGRPNVGKSTLINRLLKQDRVVVSDRPGTTRDAVESTFTHNGKTVTLVDTAGVRRIDRISDGLERTTSRIALATSHDADVTLLVMDISQGLAEQDLKLLSYLWRRGTSAIALANKWDMVPDCEADPQGGGKCRRATGMSRTADPQGGGKCRRATGMSRTADPQGGGKRRGETAVSRTAEGAAALQEEFRRRAHESPEVPFVLISAKTGHGIPRLLDTVFAVKEIGERRVKTPELNRRIQEWNLAFPSGLFRGKPGKLKYAVQTQTAPQTFKIFVNNPKTFRRESLRYLEKRFRESFNLKGVPIKIHLVQGQ